MVVGVAVALVVDAKVCRIIAFYWCWAILLPTLGSLPILPILFFRVAEFSSTIVYPAALF